MYAKIENGAIVDRRAQPASEGDWRPMVVEGRQAINPDVQREVVEIRIEPDRVRQVYSAGSRDLDAVKLDAKTRIDLEAEAARLKYITAGSGQALEYNEAAEEAVRYAATGGAGGYPMLQASVDAGEAPDLATAAALITAREDAWARIGATIRRLRLTAKRGVEAATTLEQVQAAASVTWP